MVRERNLDRYTQSLVLIGDAMMISKNLRNMSEKLMNYLLF